MWNLNGSSCILSIYLATFNVFGSGFYFLRVFCLIRQGWYISQTRFLTPNPFNPKSYCYALQWHAQGWSFFNFTAKYYLCWVGMAFYSQVSILQGIGFESKKNWNSSYLFCPQNISVTISCSFFKLCSIFAMVSKCATS